MTNASTRLPWIEPGTALPEPYLAWPQGSDAPGLLAAGADLSVSTLIKAYSKGIFPWFSDGQPILWWSPDPRMVLQVANFKVSRSLIKTLQKFRVCSKCEIRINHDFGQVIRNCAQNPRRGQNETWIVPAMVNAYCQLHQAGYAHSVETWVNGQLAGGLYCVAVGGAVFGESMFTYQTDASKIALSALVAFCKHHHITTIDCQQNTKHLASLGAHEIDRSHFLKHIDHSRQLPPPVWCFDPLYWENMIASKP